MLGYVCVRVCLWTRHMHTIQAMCAWRGVYPQFLLQGGGACVCARFMNKVLAHVFTIPVGIIIWSFKTRLHLWLSLLHLSFSKWICSNSIILLCFPFFFAASRRGYAKSGKAFLCSWLTPLRAQYFYVLSKQACICAHPYFIFLSASGLVLK